MFKALRQLLLLSGKHLFGYVLAAISALLNLPALFLLFYFIFYFEGSFTETGISVFIWMAVLSGAMGFGLRVIKLQAMRYQDPVLGAFPRAVQANKYLIGLAVIYTVFSVQFPAQQIQLFLWMCIGTRILSKLFEGLSMKMFGLKWSDE